MFDKPERLNNLTDKQDSDLRDIILLFHYGEINMNEALEYIEDVVKPKP